MSGCVANALAASLIMSNIEPDRNTSGQRVHYILIDRNGPLAEFETWEDAYRCMATRGLEGSSIIRCDGPVGERARPLAVANGSSGAEGARGQAGRSAPEPTVPKATTKVLVISEDVPTLLAMAQIVKVAGHGVAISRSAAEAVQTVEMEKPDLIIVDVDGTAEDGCDGLHVVEWLRCHHPKQRSNYIIVSAGDPSKVMSPTAGGDAYAFVRKPIIKESLLTEIRFAIGGPPELDRAESKPRSLGL